MVSHKNYNLNANEGFVMFLTSKLITCFIDGFTSKRKCQSIAYLLNDSECIYRILGLENEVHLIWVIWTSGLQKCKGNFIFRSWAERATVFSRDLKFLSFFLWGLPGGARTRAPAAIHLPLKVHGGKFNVRHVNGVMS